jgi:flavin reductase (DIM6/NTAB) family NADH-FMN oxidoreductase RutF
VSESPASPPDELDNTLEIGGSQWTPNEMYHLLSALIVPRPIAWISTISKTGIPNLAPFSYFNGICDAPPCVMFSAEGEADTVRNVKAVPEFVVNFVTVELAEKMELTAVDFPSNESEFEWATLEKAASATVTPPRVAAAKACLECHVVNILEVGSRPNHVIFGEVKHFSVSPGIWRNGRVDPVLFNPLCRLGGRYGTVDSVFKMTRPSWAELRTADKDVVSSSVRRMSES